MLRRLRLGTAAEHEDVERTLDLLHPGLERARLIRILDRMHAFWVAAEADLDRWAAGFPADAAAVDWPRRRRARLFADDLRTLGSAPAAGSPRLSPVHGTDQALGRLYVLEGSTLGGVVIDRHLASLPALADVRVTAFSPYGAATGSMWAAFRRVTRERVAAGGDPAVMVDSARATFGALADWCRPVAPSSAPRS
ncbi:MAG: bacteriophytochrome heme oxygenase BphO [uncultured Blastococcus sp.]|uniref:Bacteriophytochrome heme oxygenase BphO n=1 Tax=uncultured Blastococcus sp. TaxID=217144 RepID=A0A6J4HU30_9ACTN|nr:MAG: bacteriophytochrome heme oxygenase BphO [uncultured Blastococcus sp.]